jgi:hypothetical protein
MTKMAVTDGQKSRFPPPWSAEKIPGGYAVRDATGTLITHIFGRDAPWNHDGVPAPLTMAEARNMAARIAALAELLREDVESVPLTRRWRREPVQGSSAVGAVDGSAES